MTNRSLNPIRTAAYSRAQQLQGQTLNRAAFANYLKACDPTPKGKYQRWLLTRLYKQIESAPFDLSFFDDGSLARQTLHLFDVKKHLLPVDQRDILAYQSLKEVRQVIAEHRWKFDRISVCCLEAADEREVFDRTRILKTRGVSVHRPDSIEDLALLFGNDSWLDKRGGDAFSRMKKLGAPYIFMADSGFLLGVVPHDIGKRGVVLEWSREPGMFEDLIQSHQLKPSNAPELFDLMCRIDPTLPFDLGLAEVEPYLAALNQFPLVVHEDRWPADSLLLKLLSHPDLSEAARQEFR